MKKIKKTKPITSTQLPASLRNIDYKALLRRRDIFLRQKFNQELKEQAKPLARELLKNRTKSPTPPSTPISRRHSQYTNEQLDSYWEKQIHIVEVAESQFEKKLTSFIQKVADDFLSHLEQEISTKKQMKAFESKGYFDDNEDDLMTQAQLDFTPLLENIAILAGQEANKLIGVNEPYLLFNYRDKIAENVAKFTGSMLSTDQDALTNLIDNGLKEGKSVPEIRTSIVDTFSSYSKNQAQRITRTEVLRASNQASVDAWKQSGVVEGKQWLTAGASDECSQYEGEIVTLDNSFYSSDSEFKDGDPPLHPNCRCVVVPLVMQD